MNNKDYVFHVKWEDRYKELHRIGILAKLDEYYYLAIKSKEDVNAAAAYTNGFIGIPGFKSEEIYRSRELFDFFQSRILENNPSKQCEELSKTGGVSMVDSFSVEEIPEKLSIKYKKIVLDAYELQEELKKEGKSTKQTGLEEK